jgi:hypothetical protein
MELFMAQDTEIQVKALSMPNHIWVEVDEQAAKWLTSRSAAMLRIYQEWKQANRPQLPTPAPVAEAEPVKETI